MIMPWRSEIASTPPDRIGGALPSGVLALIALAGGGLLYLSLATPANSFRPFDPRCETWDDTASAGIARLVAIRDKTAEAFLGDAIFRLRRARRNCRSGWMGLARLDYDALSYDRLTQRYRLKRGHAAEDDDRSLIVRLR